MGQKQTFIFTVNLKSMKFKKWIAIIEYNEQEAMSKLINMLKEMEFTELKLEMSCEVWE